MNRIRLTAVAALALAALPATARAQTFWDFVALNGVPAAQGNPPVNVAGPYNVCNGALGCVALSSNVSTVHVVFKWNSPDTQVPDEKGVGLCQPSGRVCDGDEIGNVPNQSPWLLIDLSGLAPGTSVLSVT
ncbi:MAG TPA: hypothetical protein VL241_05290, partial [Gemmatimonadales bacterium]|nr:hypothetical protein [Gemmatimonadales bacterium]